ncbi:MAG: type II toxin-antitoxin system YhaV family toxin [Boseongicola sp. SB0676_bin_33]|uniref:Type II toxin-antitoxin system YhaV family toxin n=1 Tax=Boseongicola sp. SB0664_bin_43 TaxID=2604844 RepID=A0A6B0Y546_9RHOB|nr:type II toxin-antitoxin system YhaV family toxin [Boseongicola sp. SB0664_bin_43]MYF89863.1 type II toxin-antitoxin system YhaV family toxin [Boseongicola sp. SB0676_bin_33]MYK31079.1 type II toxin-antitoxin system YhaV family toxin [Boseongicola sp. SB0670_bin_30]
MTDSGALAEAPLVVNGWSIYAHPVFLDQLEGLIAEVEGLKARDPETWRRKNCTKRLAAIFKLASEGIPADPGNPAFRQGDALGDRRKHWFRAKFFQQYRLLFRFNSDARIIVLAWVNDGRTLRAYGRKADAYATFKGMLDGGNPPDDFDALMREAGKAAERFASGLKATRSQVVD